MVLEPRVYFDYLSETPAMRECARGKTQSQAHIKPLHRHFAMRLVIEGGFLPEEVTPRPPLRAHCQGRGKGKRMQLLLDEQAYSTGERTVIGGVKTKDIDVVVTKPSSGPVLAISFKGIQKAFRNLTNRLEEAVGDCTNVHLRYPALVYGYYQVVLANRASQIGSHPLVESDRDVSIEESGALSPIVQRYVAAVNALATRDDDRAAPSAYEAFCLHFVESDENLIGSTLNMLAEDSNLHHSNFLDNLLRIYDFRYPYMAERGLPELRRVEWAPESPLFALICEETGLSLDAALGYEPRLAG